MYGMDFTNDVCRVLGCSSDVAVLNVDAGVYAPGRIDGSGSTDISLRFDAPGKGMENACPAVVNHRYANRNYITLSRRCGRLVSRTGYPLTGSPAYVNSVAGICVTVSNPFGSVSLHVPLRLCFTDERPVGSVSVRFFLEDLFAPDRERMHAVVYSDFPSGHGEWSRHTHIKNLGEYLSAVCVFGSAVTDRMVFSDRSSGTELFMDRAVDVAPCSRDEILVY